MLHISYHLVPCAVKLKFKIGLLNRRLQGLQDEAAKDEASYALSSDDVMRISRRPKM